MATQIESNIEDVRMTRYNAGSERGVCIMITRDGQSISITRDEARAMAETMIAIAEGNETEVWD